VVPHASQTASNAAASTGAVSAGAASATGATGAAGATAATGATRSKQFQTKQQDKAEDEGAEFSPFDLRLNDDCLGGFNCPNSKNPSKCPKNHHKLGNIIKKGAKLPKFFCMWERPWKKGLNGKPIRCRNPMCFFAHLDGRKDFIEKSATNEASYTSSE
jgi:hypothetical protein